jgi:hypothetical protein
VLRVTRAYSNSELQSYKNCPLQWRFQWDLALRPIDDEAGDHHLRFGAAFHAGLEQLYRGKGLTAARDAFVAAYPVQLDVNDKAKTQANGVRTLVDYANRWREEDRKYRVIAIESRSDDPWSVKPDLVVENIEQGGVYLMDHKTTGQYLDYKYWGQFEPNSQVTHYLDYAQSKYGPIEGFIINAISFRFLLKASKNGPAGFWNNFERQTFNRRPAQLDYERVSRQLWVEDLERSVEVGFYRTNTGACWRCPYRTICSPGWTWEEDRDLIELNYRQVCNRLIEGGGVSDYCVLDRDHEGECGIMKPTQDVEVVVEV